LFLAGWDAAEEYCESPRSARNNEQRRYPFAITSESAFAQNGQMPVRTALESEL
jgi:hypothetical protein